MKMRAAVPSICFDDLSPWRDRESWQHRAVHEPPERIAEIWHGSKWREYQAFFDPDQQFELPLKCTSPACGKYIQMWPVRHPAVLGAQLDERETYRVNCPHCGLRFSAARRLVAGDPRHLVFQLHWDGFQSCRTTMRSSGAFSVRVLNPGLNGDATSTMIMPVMFIPKSEMTPGTDCLDPFMQLIVDEFTELFMEGIKVKYALEGEHYGGLRLRFRQRAMLFVVAGDHPAQCELLKLCNANGKHPCRRCDVQLTLVNRSWVHADIVEASMEPAPLRDQASVDRAVRQIREAKSKSGKRKRQTETGVRGRSKLHELYLIYGFCILTDTPYDIMHLLSLNVLKTVNEDTFEYVARCGRDAVETATKRIRTVLKNRTRRMKKGRRPDNPFTRLGYWHAEEHQTYVQWYQRYVLDGLVWAERAQLCELLSAVTRMFYDWSRVNGWTDAALESLRELCSMIEVLWYRHNGYHRSTLIHTFGRGHIVDDIYRFGNSSNTWCYRFESEFKGLNMTYTNNRMMELTFAKCHLRFFFSTLQELLLRECDGLTPPQRLLVSLNEHFVKPRSAPDQSPVLVRDGLVVAKSEETAIQMWLRCMETGTPAWRSRITETGILVGMDNGRALRPVEKRALQLLMGDSYDISLVSHNAAYKHRALCLHGTIFKNGTNVVTNDPAFPGNVCFDVVQEVFSVEYGGRYVTLFSAEYRRYHVDEVTDMPIMDKATGMHILAPGNLRFNETCILRVREILREVCIVPHTNARSAKAGFSIALDVVNGRFQPGFMSLVYKTPMWLRPGDVAEFSTQSGTRIGYVRETDVENHTAEVHWLVPGEGRDASRQLMPLAFYQEDTEQQWCRARRFLLCEQRGNLGFLKAHVNDVLEIRDGAGAMYGILLSMTGRRKIMRVLPLRPAMALPHVVGDYEIDNVEPLHIGWSSMVRIRRVLLTAAEDGRLRYTLQDS